MREVHKMCRICLGQGSREIFEPSSLLAAGDLSRIAEKLRYVTLLKVSSQFLRKSFNFKAWKFLGAKKLVGTFYQLIFLFFVAFLFNLNSKYCSESTFVSTNSEQRNIRNNFLLLSFTRYTKTTKSRKREKHDRDKYFSINWTHFGVKLFVLLGHTKRIKN